MAHKQQIEINTSHSTITGQMPTTNDDQEMEYPIIENCMVEVLPRTWPGSNKIGGIARVTKCHFLLEQSQTAAAADQNNSLNGHVGPTPTHIDVRYVVMGGREKMVPMEYCRPAPQYDHNIRRQQPGTGNANMNVGANENGGQKNESEKGHIPKMARANLRDRSSLLGRCKLCGSLRNDCGSCDWIEEERKRREYQHQQQDQNQMAQGENDLISSKEFRRVKNRRRQKQRQRRIKVSSLLMDDSESSDEEEDEDGNNDTFSEASQSYSNSSDESFSIRSRRNLIAARQRRVLSSSSDDDESSTDDEILARLKALPMTQVKKKKLKTKFRANNRIFKARMDFLNECLNVSKKTVVRGDSKDARRVGSNGTSVLESIGSSKNATEYGFSEMSRNESQDSMILRQNVAQYKDRNADTMTGRGDSSKQSSKEKDPIPFFQAVGITAESDTDNDIDFHQNQETHEYADTSKLRNVALETNANNTLDVDSEQNRPVSGIERRVGFVDGDDIGEKEIDEEEDEPMGEELDRGNVTQNNYLSIQQRINRNEEISGYYEDSPARNTFIQPEGNEVAENLPSDLVDRSIHLPFASLPKFLDEIQVDLSELIPSFESASCRLENELQAASNQVDKTLCKEQLLDVERRCRELYDDMCIALVRDGTDQYRCALKRFGKKREFRLGAHQLSKQQWREVVEKLDLRFDGLDKLVEDSLRCVRNLVQNCSDKNGFNMDFEVDFTPASDEESYQSDGADFERDGSTRFSSSLPKSGRHAHARRSRNNDRMQSSRDILGNKADSQLQRRKKKRKKSDTSKSRRRSEKISKWQPSIGERGHFSNAPRSSYKGDDVISNKDYCESNARTHKERSLEPNFGDKGMNQGNRKNQKGRSIHSDPTVLSTSGGKISSSHLNMARGRKSGTNQSGFQRSAQSTSYQESMQSHNVEGLDNADDAEEDAEENDEMGVEITTDSIFAALSLSTNRPNISAGTSLSFIPSGTENPFSIQNICENLSSAFPSRESNELLQELPLYFDSNILSGDSLHSSAVIVFSTLLDLLRKSGSHSLLEMITMKSQQVVVHIRLLCCVFGLMKRKVHLKLKDSDAIVYKVFSGKQFSTIVIFQIIDVLYALLLPEEWGSSVKMDSGIYKLLGDLRDELGGCMHVVEEFSHIILKFPIQEWRKSTLASIKRNAWYVSSVDPTLLELLWQGDAYSGGKCDVRLGMFKKYWPRSEINTLWGILAWFSNAGSSETTTMIRWRLIVSQFTYATGSLGQFPSTNDVAAPPSDAQLQCCREEIHRFSLLLRSGALDPMPNDDGMFLKLLLKCITLNADDPSALLLPKMFKTISKHDRKIAFKAWQESDVSYFVDTGVSNSDPLSRRLLLELSESDRQSASLFSLVPNENVSAVLHLLKDWLHRIPNKRARWSRLGDAFKGLVRKLSADASVQKSSLRQSDQKSDEIVDDFAQCFSNVGPISPGIDATVGTRQSSLCHSIVLVIVAVLASRSKRSIEFDSNFPLRIDLQVCEMIWKTVASDRMQQHQSYLLVTTSILGESDQCEDSAHVCMICMQMFSTLILSYLDQITMGEISVDEHCLTFMLSCMLSSVVTTCERLSRSSNLLSFGQPFLPSSSLESVGDINTLSCGLLWLSCIVEKANRILYKNKSKNRSKVPNLQDALDHFTPRALRVSAKCLGTIPSCVGEEATLGTCYRLALSIFRGATHSFLIQNHFQSISIASINNIAEVDNDTSSDGNPVETNVNDETEDLFGGIDDDALMAIDLDNINGTSDITEGTKRAQRIHDVCFKYVWEFLLDSLRAGKPSIRYAINQTSRHNKGSNTAQFTNTGKAVCATHSGGICALIASLCTVPELFAINESNLRSMIESLLPRNALSGFNTTTNSFSIDDEYLNDARQCLCSELCHVAKFGKNCMKIIDHMADAVILRTFLSAATNANVINEFPSFNKGIMIKIGGIQSKEKEDRSLSKALKKLESHSNNHPDAEGQSVQRHILDHCDTPGSIYMSSHFWRFCADLGIVLHSTAKDRPACERSFMLELGSSCLADDSSFFASNSLKSLPQSSLERECLKRVTLLKRILNTAFRIPVHFGTELSKIKIYTSTRTIVSSVISGLILQASCLIKGLDYYERNPSSSQPYTRAKTQALFTAYSDFMSSILSQLLLPQAIDIVSDQTEFVYRHVILPILSNQGLHINRTFFEASAGNPAGHRILNFEGGLPHTSTDQSVNSNTMLLTFCRYIGNVVQYARSGDGDHHFYEILICIQSLDDKLLRNNVFLPPAFLEGAKLLTARGQLDLGDYIELHKGDTPQSDAFNRFRAYAIRSFLLPKIKHGTITAEKKVTLLLVLLQILDFKRVQRHYTCPHPFAISTGDDQLVDYLHLSHDVKEIFSCIFLCLDSIITHKTMNSSLILYCFACIRCMLTMNVENSNLKLIEWCTAYKEENETALQIWSYMEIFFSMSKILTSSQSTVLMEQYGRPKETIASPSAISDAVLQLNDMVSKIDSARNTSCSDQENANINLYLKPGVASMAVEGVSVTPYALDENLTKVLLDFQESFSKKKQ